MRITPSTVISLVALTASVGGGSAYAAATLTANSVGSRELKDRSVQVRDLAPSARPATRARLAQAVTDVITDPATGVNIRVTGEKGEKGDAGPQGAAGAAGPVGRDGVTGVVVRTATQPVAKSGASASPHVDCLEGERALGGGGGLVDRPANEGVVQASRPEGNGWTAVVGNVGALDGTASVYAVCADVRP